ncbi:MULTISPECIES: hypothetical protein [Lysinibacillus]|uniref:Uncharacterized protein n=1 Tax=Lysinibacillus sphaericus CBAM5 TaxID=1400869 RepID=W7S4M7_LYSSH|nr:MULTISPECIES: hypothetical protein [Lysinibacillus]MBE5082916.1 hypothetical protein [Bacillus thuringiensis]AMO32794.1 hypothetical protein AR327_10285 [Lysinibacillus sphaericus]AMR92102.1 hypothetical protein A1T07_18920 [Lysinibacillus sphaericus]ANA46150.1 hypothetical protein A2J09_11590 [Lysinibacillus sphaericus]EWH33196.1 hypothetical protein P799_14330 [Lysinibacillus sphaericus CBAM5]
MAIYGVLILVVAIFLFWSAGLPNIKSEKLTFVMISLGLNIIATPLAFFIGGMATASPTSTMNDFWTGFLIVQGMPLLILIIVILKWIIIDRRKNK